MKEDASPYLGFIKTISFALKQFRLYSENHPIARLALQNLNLEMEKFFASHHKISLGSMRKLLVANGQIVSEKEPAAQDLAKDFDKLQIEGLIFERGLGLQEMVSFLNLIAKKNKDIEAKGGFKAFFQPDLHPHIKLTSGKYELVEDGQKVTDSDATSEASAAPPASAAAPTLTSTSVPASTPAPEILPPGTVAVPKHIAGIAEIIQRLRFENSTLPQGQNASPVEIDYEKVVVQLEKNPQEMAQLAIEETKDPVLLESVIRKVVNFLTNGLMSFLVSEGKDITKALDKLAKELEKSMGKAGEGAEFDDLKKKIPQIFEEAADDLRIQMMVRTYREHPEDFKMLQKLGEKILKDEKIRRRLSPELREGLVQAGLSMDNLDAILDKVEEKQLKKKNRVTIDAEELKELRKKAERFDVELSSRVKNAVQKVEREKKKILDEKERVDTVIRNLAEGLLVVDKNGKVVLMNPAAEKLLGINQSDKLGKPISDGLKEEHVVAMTSGNLKDSDDQVSKRVEVVSLNDENKRVLQASTAVIENEDGQTVGMVSVLSDVTRQKEVEEMKNKFVSNVSHELRTPLVAIQKSLGLILDKELGEINPEQQKFLNIANRNIQRLSRLINDILDVSKLEVGKMSLNIEQINPVEIAKHVLATVETWAKDKKINLKVDFPEAPVMIDADPDRLTQIMTNLVGNAMKFTPESGTISIEAKIGVKDPKLGPGDCIEIGVRDTGIGIEPQDQAKIFEKFEQVSLAQPAGVSSTGLGLTIAKEIVELHKGKIWVESEIGKGSRFVFRFPMKLK